MTLSLILIVLALICFACAAIGVASRFNLIGAGLFLWLLTNVLVGVNPVLLH